MDNATKLLHVLSVENGTKLVKLAAAWNARLIIGKARIV